MLDIFVYAVVLFFPFLLCFSGGLGVSLERGFLVLGALWGFSK